MKALKNNKIMITGAASGIGKATAIKAAKAGAKLVLIDNNETALLNTVDELSQSNRHINYVVCDLVDYQASKQAIEKSVEALGGLQALAHCAGIMKCYHTHEMSLQNWQEIIDVNLTGTFNIVHHALPFLLLNKNSYLYLSPMNLRI